MEERKDRVLKWTPLILRIVGWIAAGGILWLALFMMISGDPLSFMILF